MHKHRFSDATFYIELRKNIKIGDSKIVENIQNLYKTKHIKKKVESITKFINNVDNVNNNILDIGTEDIYFLDILQQQSGFKKTIGINIKDGYQHYNYEINENGKIIFYDGQ